MLGTIKDYLTLCKCPRCKKYLNEQMQYKLEEYGYCDCNNCNLKIENILR